MKKAEQDALLQALDEAADAHYNAAEVWGELAKATQISHPGEVYSLCTRTAADLSWHAQEATVRIPLVGPVFRRTGRAWDVASMARAEALRGDQCPGEIAAEHEAIAQALVEDSRSVASVQTEG